jgi:hypothetical protein
LFKLWSSEIRRGHNREKHNDIHIEKKISSRICRPISMKLGTNLPWVKRIKKKSQVLSQGEIITEMQKYGGTI